MKFFQLFLILSYFIFLNGCLQTTALLGPGIAVATNGNIFRAGAQYGANKVIKKQTGKDTLEHLQEALEDDDKDE